MKFYNYIIAFAVALLTLAACVDMEDAKPAGGSLLEEQVQETNAASPEMGAASFNGLYTYLGKPNNPLGGAVRPDCFSFIMITFCDDLEGADAWIPDNNYNWFSVCGELDSRNANYRNPGVRYKSPYDLIGLCNTFISSFPAIEEMESPETIYMVAQAYALRAFAYQRLAINFSFGPTIDPDALCVPLVTLETTDFANNPRATTTEVYNQILADLNIAINNLDGYNRPDKSRINKTAALALRARTYQALGEWDKAYEDATAVIEMGAAEGIAPKTAAEIKNSIKDFTAFESITEKDWIWGYDMTDVVASIYDVATSSSWIRSFSAEAYSGWCQCYTCINTLLYDKIPDTDIRKQWWVDENLKSELIEGVTWDGVNEIATFSDGGDTKTTYIPYTNVKFGCNPIATTTNTEDFPFIRVDEMYLIQAEAKAHTMEAEGAKILTNYVKTYRDSNYDVAGRNLTLLNEIWFQRRVELWGEGFFTFDMKRMGKPLVRFHATGNKGNQPDNFAFNLPADDPWLNMRFSQGELDTNHGIVDNTGGELPKPGLNPDLLDGVTNY